MLCISVAPVSRKLSKADLLNAAGQCDLIVMGTHGRKGLPRLLMGSVAEEVVRKSPCPVLTIKVPLTHMNATEPAGNLAESI